MTRGRLALVTLAPAALAGYFLVANGWFVGSEEAAEGIAKNYLSAACAQADDDGWSLLVADQREAEFGSREEYLERTRLDHCAAFDWHISSTSCDDGVCVIWLSVPAEESIPPFLAESGIVGWRTEKVPPGTNAHMAVLQRWIFGHGVIVPDF